MNASRAEPLSLRERITTRIEHEVDTRSVRLAAVLLRATKGRIVRLWGREALLLTTQGRKSGKERTVPLQLFRDGDALVVVAANSGLPASPGWYFNLKANPLARVEVGGCTLRVRAEELPNEEASAFWPSVLEVAPDYAKYPRRTSRVIPLVRLVPSGRMKGHRRETVSEGEKTKETTGRSILALPAAILPGSVPESTGEFEMSASTRWALLICDAFVALTAVAGGILLVAGLEANSFSGETPFGGYVVPGLILAALRLVVRREENVPERSETEGEGACGGLICSGVSGTGLRPGSS